MENQPTQSGGTAPAVVSDALLEDFGRMIVVKEWDNFPLWIDATRIMSVKPHVDSTPEKPRCMVCMACEKESEEWNLRTPAETLLSRLAVFHSSNAEHEPRGQKGKHA